MNSSIPPSKSENTPRHPHEPRQALRRKPAVDKIQKYVVRAIVVGHVRDRDENAKEAHQMHDQHRRLKPRQQLSSSDINPQCEQHRRPHNKCSLPRLRGVVRMPESHGALDLSACEEGGRGECCLPADDGDPAYRVSILLAITTSPDVPVR